MTIAKILAEIARKTGMSTTAGTENLAQIEHAITNAGQAACDWEGRDWWWLHATGSFDTVDDTAGYALRTVNEAAMSTLWGVTRVYWDDDCPLRERTYREYRDRSILADTDAASTFYAITAEPPTMYLWPTPNSATTIYVDYVRYHADIEDDSAASLLIVPAKFHYPVYVDGAVFLLSNGIADPAQLTQSPGFVETMRRMAVTDPTNQDPDAAENRHPDSVGGTWPHNKRVVMDDWGSHIIGDPSLT